MKPKDVVIYSDLDNTLLSSWDLGPIIVKKNIVALKKWFALGGQFSIATGRNLKNVLHFFKDFDISYPLVLVNGAMLYSFPDKKIIYKELLPNEFIEEAIDYFQKNKRIVIVLSDEKEVYTVIHQDSNNAPVIDFPHQEMMLDDIKAINVLKLTFVIFPSDYDKVISDIKNFHTYPLVNLLPSSKRFIEFVSAKVSKAKGIKKALQNHQKKLVCIGDYLNDLEMLKIADIPACPENSHEIVKQYAHIITVNNNEGAIADLIEQLLTS